jgi:hypothetical protein
VSSTPLASSTSPGDLHRSVPAQPVDLFRRLLGQHGLLGVSFLLFPTATQPVGPEPADPGKVAPSLTASFVQNALLIVVEVDDRPDVVRVVDQADMASDRDVTVMARRRRQLARQVARRGMHFPAEVPIENLTLAETGLLVRRESVLNPQPRWRVVPVTVVPVARHLLVMIVKLSMSALIVPLSPVLGKSNGSRKCEQCHRRPNRQPNSSHRFSLIVDRCRAIVRRQVSCRRLPMHDMRRNVVEMLDQTDFRTDLPKSYKGYKEDRRAHRQLIEEIWLLR